MPTDKLSSRGHELAQRLREGRIRAGQALQPGARDLPVVSGLTPKCVYTEPLENVRARTAQIATESRRIFVHGNAICFEAIERGGRSLVPLCRDHVIEPAAPAMLANLMICAQATLSGEPWQFAPPRAHVALVLNSTPFREGLPVIRTYATRPVFDENFTLLGPGWHSGPDILVHGPDVEPVLSPEPDPSQPILDRLPPRLRALLGGFCFKPKFRAVFRRKMLKTKGLNSISTRKCSH